MPMSPRLLRPRASGSAIVASDADARAYVLAVNSADGQPLEPAVQLAINDFVVGCKADGTWSAIRASCILAGARTLTGALTPLAGSAPTPVNFAAGDYNRRTGLAGDGSTKYINTNRAGNADPQNDVHAAVYVSSWSTAQAGYRAFIGSGDNQTGSTNLFWQTSPAQSAQRSRNAAPDLISGSTITGNLQAGLYGMTRSGSSAYTLRANASSLSITRASESPPALNWWVFTANNNGTAASPTSSRLLYYSVGTSLDLALLGSRLATLANAIGAAIP